MKMDRAVQWTSIGFSVAAAALFAGCGSPQPIAAPRALPPEAHAVADHGFKSLYSFANRPDGANPQNGVIAIGHTLYGATLYGGANDFGTVFSLSKGGTESVLYSFAETPDGEYPLGELLARHGVLYGTTSGGGSGNAGTVFSVTSAGAESVLYSLEEPDGNSPWAAVTAKSGTFYGTALDGGSKGFGTVYALNASGNQTVLHDFGNQPDGADPQAPVVDVNGTLYGTTNYGGTGSCSEGCGTVFAVGTSGSERILYNFAGEPDGERPGVGGLLLDRGELYGTTPTGGANDAGAVFKVTLSGSESIVYSFKGDLDGEAPNGTLVDYHGTLYGTTTEGGGISCKFYHGCGTIFSINASGTERVLFRFTGGSDGAYPQTPLTVLGGRLYGTTVGGGTDGNGTVFSIAP
jgi:uncharacterized repeat protein (TIGR03803 family)